ncbi:MAG: glycosyltransferase family 2 protein [Bacteroidetes bacterium]|nr:glycosyltransferase family 2 protein [Bacteroidota bacterium]
MSSPIKLSVVIITFNEEKNIGRCLDAVKPIADEIVVLDSFSTDATEKICREKGAKFFQHKFDGHIEQKNRAITHATYPHVLSLDADEAPDEKLQTEILKIKNDWTHDGYEMNRLTNYCGKWIKHCGWYPDRKLRLWDSRKGKWGGINPHDEYKMTEKNAKVKHIDGNILHYSFYSISDHYKQVEYFTTISAKAMFAEKKTGSVMNLIFSPPAKFLKCYFLQLGFLDGYYGFVISKISAKATFMKYKKLKQLGRG